MTFLERFNAERNLFAIEFGAPAEHCYLGHVEWHDFNDFVRSSQLGSNDPADILRRTFQGVEMHHLLESRHFRFS